MFTVLFSMNIGAILFAIFIGIASSIYQAQDSSKRLYKVFFWREIQNFAGNSKFGGKLKFNIWREIQNLAGNSKFGVKFKIWREIQNLSGNSNSKFGGKFKIWPEIQNLAESSFSKFGGKFKLLAIY